MRHTISMSMLIECECKIYIYIYICVNGVFYCSGHDIANSANKLIYIYSLVCVLDLDLADCVSTISMCFTYIYSHLCLLHKNKRSYCYYVRK